MEVDFSQEHQTLKAREEEFRGKHVIVIGTEIYPIEDGEQAARLLERLRKQHPGKIPLLAYVMREDTYILDIPALLGRQEFFETFKVTFEGHEVTFTEPRRRGGR